MIPLATQNLIMQGTGKLRPFLQPLSEPGHFLLVIDNTSLDVWKRCPQAARNYIVLRRQSPVKNAALAFGGVIHEGIEQALLGASDDDIVKAMVNYWTDNTPPADEYRTLPNAVEVVGHYRKRLLLPDYTQEILSDAIGPIIERAFELPIGVIEVDETIAIDGVPTHVVAVHVAWSGRIDLVARCGPGNLARVQDHKTTSVTGEYFTKPFQLSSQTCGYVWAGRQLWPELNLTSFCLDALHIKKPGKDQGLTQPGPRGGEAPLSFSRTYFDYTEERIAQWHDDTLAHISDFIHCLVRDRFPFNDKQCVDKYGTCQYHEVCTIDSAETRERYLLSDCYQPVTWNPTHE